MERKGKIEDLDRSFDIQFGRLRSDAAKFVAAWELVTTAYNPKGRTLNELRLQRTIEHFQPLPGYASVIGGYAVIKYTEPRYTKDLDLWVSTERGNANAVFQALQEFGAPLVDMTEKDFAYEGYFYQMGRPPVRVDILMSVSGLTFDKAWNNRVETEIDGIIVPFISREDLITTKLASGRPQDLIDAEALSQESLTTE